MPPESKPSGDTKIHAGAFVFWLLIQLVALGISAGRFPFFSRFPTNGEQYALPVMLVAQALAVSILSPLLLRDVFASLAAIAVAWPMAELAAFLADSPASRAAMAEGYISVWMIGLMLWMRAMPSQSGRLWTGTIATLAAVTGPVLWYLRAEFGAQNTQADLRFYAAIGPVMGAIGQLSTESAGRWWFVISVGVAGGAGLIWSRRTRPSIR